MAYLLCLTSGGGVPIFSRSKGDLKPLPFPVIGGLNGVHMFGAAQDAILQSARTEHGHVVWKMFEDALTLILVTGDDGASHDRHALNFLDLVYNAVVLLSGSEDVVSLSIRNVERLKKEVKLSLTLVDHLLRNGQNDLVSCMADLTRAVDVLHSPDHVHLQPILDSFTTSAQSPYGCLMIHNRLAFATDRWWSLPPLEQSLMLLLVASLPQANSRDVPVFLPVGSPKIAHRLLTFRLMAGAELAVICGPQPSLASLLTEVERFWRPAFDAIRSLTKLAPRFVPESVKFDPNLMGFLLVDIDRSRCLWSVQPSASEERRTVSPGISSRIEFLRSYYRKISGQFFPLPPPLSKFDEPEPLADGGDPQKVEKNSRNDSVSPADLDNRLGRGFVQTSMGIHQIAEIYQCSDNHKCYAVNAPPLQFVALFSTAVPTFAMRSATHKTLEILTPLMGASGAGGSAGSATTIGKKIFRSH